MESPPTEDPGEGNCPVGTLTMVTAAVCHLGPIIREGYSPRSQVERAYRMHSTGDYIEATQSFNAEFCGHRTTIFMEYITKDLTERHWDGIFRGLAAMSKKVTGEVAAKKGSLQVPHECVPLPPSNPPSPPAKD